jgi:hypothetical protein
MPEKKKRSDVVRACAAAACDKWFLESGRYVSGKIFYRILAALESAMPAHFSERRPAVAEESLPLEEFMVPTHPTTRPKVMWVSNDDSAALSTTDGPDVIKFQPRPCDVVLPIEMDLLDDAT